MFFIVGSIEKSLPNFYVGQVGNLPHISHLIFNS
jgi:hypothetical protein